MDKTKLKDRHCLGLVRASRKKQARNSHGQQAAWLKSYCEENGMLYVGERAEAVSASQTDHRPDLDYLLERKKVANDFDTVLVQDLSRFTRGGAEHGLEWFFKLKQVGVLILSVLDGLIDGDDKLEEAVKRLREARAAAKATAMVVTRGLMDAINSGRFPYSLQVPYGIDRMVLDGADKPLYVLRNLADGSQLLLDANDASLIRAYPPNTPEVWRHYVRQHDEKITLVPGDPERLKAINLIYKWRYIDGLGFTRIAVALNERRIPAALGGEWSRSSVRTITMNPIYLGRGVGHRQATGDFFKTGTGACPVPMSEHPHDPSLSDNLNSMRPESEWLVREYPALHEIVELPADKRKAILEKQLDELRRFARRESLRPGCDRHQDSSYILKGILRAKQGGYPMSGRTQKPRVKGGKKTYRYYSVSRGRSVPVKGSLLGNLIPADRLEQEALKWVKVAASAEEEFETAVREALEAHATEQSVERDLVPNLLKQRDELRRQLSYWVKQVAQIGEDEVDRQTGAVKAALAEVTSRIATAQKATSLKQETPEVLVERMRTRCREFVASIERDPVAVRRLLSLMVAKLEVDLETREVEMEMSLPAWAIGTSSAQFNSDELCLDDPIVQTVLDEAYGHWRIPMGRVTCERAGHQKDQKYRCRRRKPVFKKTLRAESGKARAAA